MEWEEWISIFCPFIFSSDFVFESDWIAPRWVWSDASIDFTFSPWKLLNRNHPASSVESGWLSIWYVRNQYYCLQEVIYLRYLASNTDNCIIVLQRLKILTGFITFPEKPKETVSPTLPMHLKDATLAPIANDWAPSHNDDEAELYAPFHSEAEVLVNYTKTDTIN